MRNKDEKISGTFMNIRSLVKLAAALSVNFGDAQESRAFLAMLGCHCLWKLRTVIPEALPRDLNSLFHSSLFDSSDIEYAACFLEQRAQRQIIAEADSNIFASLYEELRTPVELKRRGIYYTPSRIAASMAGRALQDLTACENTVTMLDPACGGGAFLIEALKALQRATPLVPASEILRTSIFGVDIDSGAVELCRLLLQLASIDLGCHPAMMPDLSSNIRSGNSLLSPDDFPQFDASGTLEKQAFSFEESFPEIMAQGGFTCVLGNPPYGLSRGEQLSARENMLLKNKFRNYREGKVNKYMLFMVLSMELLREGGRCTLIVPNSWLGIRGASKLRRILLTQGNIEEVEVLSFPAFSQPSVETVICTLSKQGRNEIRIRRAGKIEELGTGDTFEIKVTDCLRTPGTTIPVQWSDGSAKLLQAIERNCLPLRAMDNLLIPLIALQVYSTGKGTPPQTHSDVRDHVFHSTARDGEDYYPYLRGEDVQRYNTRKPELFLRYGPWLAEHHPFDRFSRPRIVVREILGKEPYLLTAAFVSETLFYNRSILHILGGPRADEDDLFTLLAILNSAVASEIIKLLGQKSQRKLFPKIVNDDLLNFPLPRDWEGARRKLAGAARSLNSLSPDDSVRRRELELDVDRHAAECYMSQNDTLQAQAAPPFSNVSFP